MLRETIIKIIQMTWFITSLTNNLNNDFVFYGVFIGVAGAIGYSFIKNKFLSKTYFDKDVQTDTVENFSDSPSQIFSDNVTSTETLSPLSSIDSLTPLSSTETLSPSSSTDSLSTICSTETLSPTSSIFKNTSSLISRTSDVGIQTITGDVRPNQAIVDLTNAEYIANKVDQLNAIDPFAATPWTPDRLLEVIDVLGIVNNLFN